jgi:pilus assembly protein CpaF
MALTDRFRRDKSTPQPAEESSKIRKPVDSPRDNDYQDLKSRVHSQLFEHLDLSRLGSVSEERISKDIELLARRILEEENVPLTQEQRKRLIEELRHEVFGLGPLEPLLADPTVCDILVNGYNDVFVERAGKLEKTAARFKDDAHLMKIVEKITTAVGRRIDETSPMVDARLADGSRVNVIIPPLALDGPMMSIRRFAVDPLSADDLIDSGSVTEPIMRLLEAAVRCKLNVVISGGTGAGKTTMLNVLSGFIPADERIVTIEDSAELQLRQDHIVRLETRPANIEGRGQISQRELVINSLRMRPDRIVVGEVRGGEALDMLQAMNTGHDGSLTTIHANSPRDALARIETMVAMTGVELPQRAVRQQISSAIQVVIQLSRLSDGTRRLVSLQEITGMEGDIVTMQEIFKLHRRGMDAEGRIAAEVVPTGLRPKFTERLRDYGVELGPDFFEVGGIRAVG